MVRVLFALTVAAALAGCATQSYRPKPYLYWGKEGVSAQAARDQLGYCRHDVGAAHLAQEQAQKLINYCMRSKGYTIMTGYR